MAVGMWWGYYIFREQAAASNATGRPTACVLVLTCWGCTAVSYGRIKSILGFGELDRRAIKKVLFHTNIPVSKQHQNNPIFTDWFTSDISFAVNNVNRKHYSERIA